METENITAITRTDQPLWEEMMSAVHFCLPFFLHNVSVFFSVQFQPIQQLAKLQEQAMYLKHTKLKVLPSVQVL